MRLTNRDVRVSDAERQQAAELLGDHLRSGRLTLDEYDQRAGVAYSARTYGELRRLFADLPRPPLAAALDPELRQWTDVARRILFRAQVAVLCAVLALVALIVLAVHLPAWIIAVPAALLALRWWRHPSRRLRNRARPHPRRTSVRR